MAPISASFLASSLVARLHLATPFPSLLPKEAALAGIVGDAKPRRTCQHARRAVLCVSGNEFAGKTRVQTAMQYMPVINAAL